MATPESPRVEVVYALPDRQRTVFVVLTAGMTAMDAVTASGLLEEFAELAGGRRLDLGVFGEVVPASRVLADGDRVKI